MTGGPPAYRVHLARTGELPPRSTALVPVAPPSATVTMIAHLAEDVGVEQ